MGCFNAPSNVPYATQGAEQKPFKPRTRFFAWSVNRPETMRCSYISSQAAALLCLFQLQFKEETKAAFMK